MKIVPHAVLETLCRDLGFDIDRVKSITAKNGKVTVTVFGDLFADHETYVTHVFQVTE